MTAEQLTAALAKRFLGWDAGPDRFLLGNRRWIRRSRFDPTKRVQDGFRLLGVAATEFSVSKTARSGFTATVQIKDRTGTASGPTEAATITRAIARAVGLDLEDGQ